MQLLRSFSVFGYLLSLSRTSALIPNTTAGSAVSKTVVARTGSTGCTKALRSAALYLCALTMLTNFSTFAQNLTPASLSSNSGGILVVAPYEPSQIKNSNKLPSGLPSDTRNEPVDFGQELRVWTVWYLNTYNCTSLGTGTITASQGPHYGTNRFDVEDATLPPGYPQTTVFDFFHLHYVSDDRAQAGDVDRAPELVGKGVGDCCSQPGSAPVGDPISVGNGNVFEKVVDYQTAGQNKLSFIRYYNSLGVPNTFSSSLGVNWRSNYDRYVNIVSPNMIVVERPWSARQILYQWR
jgi:hypothetical protein